MIHRISLRNWRAYESAQIPFEEGTTFIVAPNGIGKTSLLEAAKFALTGDSSTLTAPVLLHEDHAEVELVLGLSPGRVLVMRRTLYADPDKPQSLVATIGDAEASERELVVELERSFAADANWISRNAFLSGRLDSTTPSSLRSLLVRAYGLDAKRTNADQLASLANEQEAIAKELSRSIRREAKETAVLQAELAAATSELATAKREQDKARVRFDELSNRRSAYIRNEAIRERLREWVERSTQVLGEVRLFLPTVTVERLTSDVEALVTRTERNVATLQQQLAAMQARIDLIETALSELHSAGADCPVCLRPLDDDDKVAAEARHMAELSQLRERFATIDLPDAAEHLRAARALMRQIDTMGARPPMPPADPASAIDPEPEYDLARSQLEQAAARLQTAQTRVEQLTTAVSEARATEAKATESERAWRRWALTSAASTSLHNAINDALTNQIEPIAEAVSKRWDSFFEDRPHLWFDLDGDMWRNLGEKRLPIGAFSTGERTTARLLMQLAILTIATRVDFCWLDEPLEHLDPRNRRRVGAMLSHGREATGLRQLVITTYEEELAQELANADEQTAIEYVRAGAAASRPD
jgi:DNA repair exonuclease SbcCD ATPase subunit